MTGELTGAPPASEASPAPRSRARRWPAGAGLAAVAIILACTGRSGPTAAPRPAAEPWEAVLDGLEVEAGQIGWGGVRLEMSRRQAEQVLGAPLAVEELEAPVCGSHFADVPHHGRTLTVQLAGTAPTARVESLHLSLPDPGMPVEKLKEALKTRLPALRYRPSRHQPELPENRDSTPLYVIAEHPDQAILLKPEEGLYLALAGCLE